MANTGNHIESAMRSHGLVYIIVACLVAFGIYSLPKMNKDEFPEVTIRLGVVAGIYPGATAQEVEEQVAKPIEQYLFSFKEIDKRKTYSLSQDGIVYVFAALSPRVMNADEAWAKIRGGISLLKQTQLPTGLLALVVVDDFGNTSSMLLAVESTERTPRELEDLANRLSDQLRAIPEMGSIKILGTQREEIAVTLDVERISKYAVDQKVILARLATQGFRTMTGEIANDMGAALIHVDVPYKTEYELGEQIVFYEPVSGQNVRLKDIATIERRYQKQTKFIQIMDEDSKGGCVMLNIEMQPGNNIVAFGNKVDKIIKHVEELFPPDVEIHKVTDQPRVVNASVRSFLKDLVVSVIIVILVMLVLFPLRTALVSSTGLPVCIAITWGVMYLFGIELNTVTLAALIVVLGMVVDDFIALTCSIFYATWIIPYMATVMIKPRPRDAKPTRVERIQSKFFEGLQKGYQHLLDFCFRHPWITIGSGVGAVALGVLLFTMLDLQLMPKAERDCFAVEIHLTQGSSLSQTISDPSGSGLFRCYP